MYWLDKGGDMPLHQPSHVTDKPLILQLEHHLGGEARVPRIPDWDSLAFISLGLSVMLALMFSQTGLIRNLKIIILIAYLTLGLASYIQLL